MVNLSDKRIKLADFGLTVSRTQSLVHGAGTLFYMAPEALLVSCFQNDIWSVGIVLLEMLHGSIPPYYAQHRHDVGALCAAVSNADYSLLTHRVAIPNEKVGAFLQRCLARDSRQRALCFELFNRWMF